MRLSCLFRAAGAAGLIATTVCCAPPPRPPDAFEIDLPGPALMEKADGGYELKNRHIRLVIDGHSGDASYFGVAEGGGSALGPAGLAAVRFSQAGGADGYVEKRDEQTWQFYGRDAEGAIWRKIYCMEGDCVFVTYLIENQSGAGLEDHVLLWVDLDRPTYSVRLPALLEAQTPAGRLTMRGFVQQHDLSPTTASATRRAVDSMRGDTFTLKPGERASFTMEWKLQARK